MSAKLEGILVSIYCGDEWWLRSIIRRIWRIGHAAHMAKWWLLHRLHPKHRYHVVRTGLQPGYYDCDHLMLSACFSLLGRYVEVEMGGVELIEKFNDRMRTHPDPNAPDRLQEAQANSQDEAVALWKWWTITRPADHRLREELTETLYGASGNLSTTEFSSSDEGRSEAVEQELWGLEERISSNEQTMLHRLVSIRGSLWT